MVLSVFWAVSMDIPGDDICANFVAMFARDFPRPWMVHRMPMKRVSLWVIFSTLIHEAAPRDPN